MPLIFFQTHDGNTFEADIPAGTTLMQGAVANGIEGIKGECGGNMRCATCVCMINEPQAKVLGVAEGTEFELLAATTDYNDSLRLSCQITITENMEGWQFSLPEAFY